MFERGDLLLVPFTFSDLSASKRRPVGTKGIQLQRMKAR